jgi:hypothetical protein
VNAATVAAPVVTKTKTRRRAANGKCPSGCTDPVTVRGSSAKCGGCGLVAPRSAFLANGQSSNAMDGAQPQSRAWTMGGGVD